MINFNTDLVQPVITLLNNALNAKTGNEYTYSINDVPKNFRYQFKVSTDVGEYEHAVKEQDGLHQNGRVYINGIAEVNPVSLDGVTDGTYNALVDASIAFILPLNRMRGTTVNSFVNEFRRLVDTTLQSSQSGYVTDGATIYQKETRYSLLQTGERGVRPSAGDSIEFTLYLSFSIVAAGISSDSIVLTIDGERVYPQRLGIARKSVKELGIPAGGTSQKSYESGTLLALSFDLPARFSSNSTSTLTYKSFNEKVAAFALNGTNDTFSVTLQYPKTITKSGTTITTQNQTGTYNMKFDSVGINGETGLAASQSITLMEV